MRRLIRRAAAAPALQPAPAASVAATAAGPFALATLVKRTKTRDAVLFALQMWAFVVIHELPYDDPEALRRRLKVRYPIRVDRRSAAGRCRTRACSGR